MFRKWFLTLVFFLAFPLLGSAQMFKGLNLQLNTGTAIPLSASHFEKYWSPGFHFGGGLEFSITEMIVLKWEAAFNTFIFKHEDWKTDLINVSARNGLELDDFVVNGGNRYILETSLGAKIFPLSKEHINPFLALGVGILNMSTDQLLTGLSGPEFITETVPYFTAGLGSDVAYWKGFKLFGQVVYKYALTKDENNFKVAIDFEDKFKKQETGLLALEFGIIFDIVK